MFGLSKQIVGLDIGFESIKVVCVEKSGKNRKVVGFNEIPLPEPIIESDHIKDKSKIAELIKKGFAASQPQAIKARFGVADIPEFLVFSKTIQLPKMEESELKAAALNQASQYIPVAISDVNIDSQVLIAHPDEPVVDVLVVATPKALINEYLEMFKLVGLEMLAFETKALAAVRSIVAPTDTAGILILEIGTVTSRISIVDNRSIRFVSTINTGGDQIIRQLVSDVNNRQEFLEVKYKTGLKIKNDSAEMIVDKIVEDLVKAIRYHQNRDYKAARIAEIRVCGSGALIPNICQTIQEKIKIKTVPGAYVLPNLPKGFDQRYVIALGLALYKEGSND